MRERIVVINSTPIIALSAIDGLFLLKELYGVVYIPKAVYDEVTVKAGSKAQLELLKAKEWILTKSICNYEAKKFFKVQLHDGEVEVMILGKELEADLLIIDDYTAREYARYLDFKVTGSLGVILKAKENSVINIVKPLIDGLIKNGIYISDSLYRQVLSIANEL